MASPRNQVVMGSGYESPTEDNQPPFFHTPPMTDGLPTHRPPPRRPFVQRQLYAVSAPPSAQNLNVPNRNVQTQDSNLSLNDVIANSDKPASNGKVSIKDRIACYQWTYFTMTMSTGGVANALHQLKWDSPWIIGIGTFFCLLNIFLFVMNCIFIFVRFRLRPGSFTNSFTDQVESLFIPAFFVSIGMIMITICEYGVPHAGVWLLQTMEVMFCIYIAVSMFASAGLYLVLWSTLVFPIHTMTPTWVFPAYPLLLSAPFAANLVAAAEASGHPLSSNVIGIALSAGAAQGTGCLIAFMISAAFIYRLMTQKLPRDAQRPGVFMSIGPFGFTASGIAQLGKQANLIVPSHFMDTQNTVSIVRVVCVLVSLWLYGLALWFFLVSVGSLWKYVRVGSSIPFQITWWSFVFPNTALVTATEVLANIFDSRGMQIFSAVMTVALIIVWVAVFGIMLWCLKEKKLLYPKNDS